MYEITFATITNWIDTFLGQYMPEWLVTTVECLLIGVGLLLVYALLALFYIYFERNIGASSTHFSNSVYDKIPADEQLSVANASMRTMWEALKNDTW